MLSEVCFFGNSPDFRLANISLQTAVRWLSEDVASFEIEVGVYEKIVEI